MFEPISTWYNFNVGQLYVAIKLIINGGAVRPTSLLFYFPSFWFKCKRSLFDMYIDLGEMFVRRQDGPSMVIAGTLQGTPNMLIFVHIVTNICDKLVVDCSQDPPKCNCLTLRILTYTFLIELLLYFACRLIWVREYMGSKMDPVLLSKGGGWKICF